MSARKKKIITIHVRGGVAYPPARVPAGVEVRIIDYDNITERGARTCTQCEQPARTSPCFACRRLNKKWDRERQ